MRTKANNYTAPDLQIIGADGFVYDYTCPKEVKQWALDESDWEFRFRPCGHAYKNYHGEWIA